MNNKTNYLSQFIKKGYLLISLLLTSIALTAIVGIYEFNLLSILRKYDHILLLALICGLLFGVAIATYLIVGVENKKISIADSIYFAMLLCGVAYLLYILIGLNYPTKKNLIVSIALIIAGAFFVAVRILFFNRINNGKTTTIKRYFVDLIKKYNFVTILICSVIVVCLAYFITDYKVVNLIATTKMFIICLILVLPALVYGVKSSVSSSLTLFDVLAVCATISLPIIALLIYVFSFSLLKLMLLVVLGCALVAYFVLRFLFYNPDKIKQTAVKKNGYINALFNKFCVLEIASIGGIIALVATLLICSDVLHPLYRIRVAIPHVNVLPALVLALSSIIALLFFASIALLGASKKGIGIIDYALACCIAFVLFGFVGLIAHPSIIMLIGLSAFLIYTCLILIVRIKSYKN